MLLAQLFGEGNWISSVIWLLIFFVMIFVYPKLMIYQVVTKIEKELNDLEKMKNSSQNKILKKITKKPTKKLKKKISDFLEFFIAAPVSLDPYGIVDKIHDVVKLGQKRELGFVEKIAPKLGEDRKLDVMASISSTSGINQIIKIIRHYLELIKKYKILQLAMIIQMQIPLIKRIAKAFKKATDAFMDNAPIGDGIGPLVVASMIPKDSKVYKMKKEEFSYTKEKIEGKRVILAKASGPGATIGYPGKFVKKLIKKEKIDRIITVDAASALEGEQDGQVMEGVGIGGRGQGMTQYHGFIIEEVATKKNIPVDSIGIKEVSENAIYPMKKEIYESLPEVKEKVKEMIKRGKKNERILILGFGNTSGVRNTKKDMKKTEKIIKKKIKEMKKEEEEEEKKKGGLLSGPGGFSLNLFNLIIGARSSSLSQQEELRKLFQKNRIIS